jgi:hypothetical protein
MVVVSRRFRDASRLCQTIFASVALVILYSAPAAAQKSPLGNQDNGGLNGSLSRSDLEKLNGDHDKHGKSLAPAEAKEQSAKLLAALSLPCEISNAQQVANGTRRIGGKETPVKVFEVACSQAMGYLLESQGPSEPPVAISCLHAEEARASDVAKGKEPGFFCKLPENWDVHALVTSLIAAGAGGAQCTVQQLQWLGRSESSHSEYSEVACQDGKGYVLRTALPGSQSQAKATATTCAESARQGIRCRLTDSGPAAAENASGTEADVTLDTLKAALAQHGVSCKIDPIRLIGQEDHLKRWVVEYHCADSPAGPGRIAFVPLPGNTNPYESIDCSAGSLRGIPCLNAPAAK